MSEIVRGVITNLDDFVELDKPSGLAFDTKVLVLPIEDGEVGDFEPWMVEYLEGNLYALPREIRTKSSSKRWREVANARIVAAISRLFEEVESED